MAIHPSACPEGYQETYHSYNELADAAVINAVALQMAFQLSGADEAPTSPEYFVVHSDHLKDFPPTWISSNGQEALRDDAIVLERSLRETSVPVKRLLYEGYPHWFHVYPTLEKRVDFMNDIVDGIHWTLKQSTHE